MGYKKISQNCSASSTWPRRVVPARFRSARGNPRKRRSRFPSVPSLPQLRRPRRSLTSPWLAAEPETSDHADERATRSTVISTNDSCQSCLLSIPPHPALAFPSRDSSLERVFVAATLLLPARDFARVSKMYVCIIYIYIYMYIIYNHMYIVYIYIHSASS
jgi:hypothetical protein